MNCWRWKKEKVSTTFGTIYKTAWIPHFNQRMSSSKTQQSMSCSMTSDWPAMTLFLQVFPYTSMSFPLRNSTLEAFHGEIKAHWERIIPGPHFRHVTRELLVIGWIADHWSVGTLHWNANIWDFVVIIMVPCVSVHQCFVFSWNMFRKPHPLFSIQSGFS